MGARIGHIYLTGMMGVGKSTVGSLLSEAMNLPHTDIDSEIVRESGDTISEIFRKDGETSFRDKESHMLAELSGRSERIISLGGGTLMRERNIRRVLSTGCLVYLEIDPAVLAVRLTQSHVQERPLLHGSERTLAREMFARFEERRPGYEQAQIRVDVSTLGPEEVCAEIVARLQQDAPSTGRV